MPQNPVPRIGRKGKKFKPSKKLQKKYRKVKEKYEEELEDIGFGGVPQPPPRPPIFPPEKTKVVNNVTILSNIYGLEETAELLGIDVESLQRALQGYVLTRRQEAIIQRAYSDLILSNDDIDFDEVESHSEQLEKTLTMIDEKDIVGGYFEDTFRMEVASGRVDLEYLDKDSKSILVWMKLPPRFKQIIFDGVNGEYMKDGKVIEVDLNAMFNAAIYDFQTIGDIGLYYGSEGEWWKWFFETFYS